MRSISFFSALRNVSILIFIILFMHSCHKKDQDQDNLNCLFFINEDMFRFNVLDKTTGENLFFSNSPRYSQDQIYVLINDRTVRIKPQVETSGTLGQHFLIRHTAIESGKIRVFIADNQEYTIDFTVKSDTRSGCPRWLFDKLVINGDQTEENIQGRVILLRK